MNDLKNKKIESNESMQPCSISNIDYNDYSNSGLLYRDYFLLPKSTFIFFLLGVFLM